MKIYTKTGDDGTSALFGGKRVSKADARIEAYGTIDELNAYIGLVRDQEVNKARLSTLTTIQDRLFSIGSILATEPDNSKVKVPNLRKSDITFLEEAIDDMDSKLTPLKSFILPGGNQSVSFCHITRTVCRRAERKVVALSQSENVDFLVIIYLNRLSDYLFVLGRKMAQESGSLDTPWVPKF